MDITTIKWENSKLLLIDQTKLPNEIEYHEDTSFEGVFNSIRTMIVRGAPAIGVTAGYGMYFAAREIKSNTIDDFLREFEKKGEYLKTARPTAVNLEWAINRMINKANILARSKEDVNKASASTENKEDVNQKKHINNIKVSDIVNELEREAVLIHKEDIDINKTIGENLLTLVKDGDTILTHCNAGSLATSQYGTALSVFYVAKEKGIILNAYADETRPRLQGASLTSFELYKRKINVTLITDNMTALVMSQGKIDCVIVGCDRVAANGDVANKIGTYGVSILANHFNIPVYVATPTPTIDFNCETGKDIPIEERHGDEIRKINGTYIAPKDVKVYNPSFDVTPSKYISAIVTEKGIVRAPFKENLRKIL